MPPQTQHPSGAILRDTTEYGRALDVHLIVGACIRSLRAAGRPYRTHLGTYGESLTALRSLARDDAAYQRASRAGCRERATQARHDTRLAAATVTVHPDGTMTLTDPFGALPYVHDRAA